MIFEELELLANLNNYDKVSTTEQSISVNSQSFFQGFYRFFSTDNRYKSFSKIEQIFETAFDSALELAKMKQPAFAEEKLLNRYLKAITRAMNCFDRLRITYSTDVKALSRISTINITCQESLVVLLHHAQTTRKN